MVGPDRPRSGPVTPYVGKRARRDVVMDEQQAQPAQPVQPYVGRRASRPVADAPVAPAPAPATPYVGRRMAAPVAATPAPVDIAAAPVLEPVIEPAVAFVKPVAPVALLEMPTPSTADWNLFATESPEDTGQLPFALTEAFTGSLPRIDALPGTDFS